MKKNLAVIGFGGMGEWHVNFAKNSDVLNLTGIYDIKEERNLHAKQSGIGVYSSLEEVLNDEKVDLITIATPNDVHREIAEQALLAGKHVVSEKPVTLNSAELESILNVSKKADKLFSVHQNRRWDADFLAIKQVYESGEIGSVFNIESRVQGSRGIPGDWRKEKKHGGGMVLDWGVHLIDQILLTIKANIVEIYCRLDHLTNAEVDDGFKLEMIFDNQCRAYIEVGTLNFISLPRFYMLGCDGSAVINDWHQNCKVSRCTKWAEEGVKPVVTAAGLTKTMAPRNAVTIEEYEVELPKSDVHDFYRNFTAAIDKKEEMLVQSHQVMRVMKVMEAAFESDRQGQKLSVNL